MTIVRIHPASCATLKVVLIQMETVGRIRRVCCCSSTREDPAASWLTYLVIGFGFILGAALALIVRMGRDQELVEDELFESKDTANLDLLTMDMPPPEAMIPLADLPPLPVPAGLEPVVEQQIQGGESNG